MKKRESILYKIVSWIIKPPKPKKDNMSIEICDIICPACKQMYDPLQLHYCPEMPYVVIKSNNGTSLPDGNYRVIDGELYQMIDGVPPVTTWAPDGALPYPFNDDGETDENQH